MDVSSISNNNGGVIMEKIMEYLPLLVPIILVQLILMITALTNLIKNRKVKVLSVPVWMIIILLVNIIGPTLYFIFGRVDE